MKTFLVILSLLSIISIITCSQNTRKKFHNKHRHKKGNGWQYIPEYHAGTTVQTLVNTGSKATYYQPPVIAPVHSYQEEAPLQVVQHLLPVVDPTHQVRTNYFIHPKIYGQNIENPQFHVVQPGVMKAAHIRWRRNKRRLRRQ